MNQKCCASLKLSKRLKELGFPQETDFYWHRSWNPTLKKENEIYLVASGENIKPDELNIAAPHVGELVEWLPSHVFVERREALPDFDGFHDFEDYYWFGISKTDNNTYECHYKDNSELWPKMKDFDDFESKTLADSLAKMLIFLAENGHIDPKNN